MELGYLVRDFQGTSSPLEQTEHQFGDLESERTSEIEFPSLSSEKANDAEIRWNPVDSERESVELPHIENGYYSTYEERIKQTPRENSDRGDWSGKRGESEFTPNDKEVKMILEKYGTHSISYKDGIPDFRKKPRNTRRKFQTM